MDISATPSPTTLAAPRRFSRTAFWLFAASLGVCALAYLAITVQGSWLSAARTLHWTPRDLNIVRGTGELGPEGLALKANDASNAVLVSVNTAFRSSDYAVIAWKTTGIPDDAEVGLLWRNDYEPGRVFNRRLDVEAGRVQPFSLLHDPNWVGRISGLALAVKGVSGGPVIVQGATAKTMSPREIMGDRVSEWFTFEPWNGASINTLIGGADTQDLPMAFAFAVIVGVAALIYRALARWRPQWVGPFHPSILGALFVVAWIALDVRWQWNLARQVMVTEELYGGKSWRDRHLVADDRMVFAFIEKVRAKLPPPPVRVFMVADEHYYRDRGAYHLYPYNVFFSPWDNSMPPPSAVRSGDYFVVYQRRGVQYDPASQRLRWDGNAPIPAELVFSDGGAAMFRIQ